jgi:predicted phosphodiesterase
MSEKFTITNLAREYREKYGNKMPTLKLARIMAKENPLLFSGVEAARSALRYIEFKIGKPTPKKLALMGPERPRAPYNIPESSRADRKPFLLPESCNNILLISDLHIPYHDVKAIEIALDYGLDNDINCIFINGDLIDFHMLSKFDKDPRKRSVKYELDTAKEVLRIFRRTFPEAAIYWLKGNHCVRYEKWLMTKVYEIFDDEYYHLEQRLRLNEEGVVIIDDKIHVKAGNLSITHGHHLMRGFFSPVNSSRGAWMKAKQSVIIGHVHRHSSHTEVNMDGDVTGTWSTGCLCELKPDYNPLVSNYQHGFAHIKVFQNKKVQVRNFQIQDYKIY